MWESHVSFSKVTVALCGLSEASEAGVTEREVILPLLDVSIGHDQGEVRAYQKLKKSLTSFSLVPWWMFLTCNMKSECLERRQRDHSWKYDLHELRWTTWLMLCMFVLMDTVEG